MANEYRGMYFGAAGKLACVSAADAAPCVIERAETGETAFMVADTGAATGLQPSSGTWHFTPDPGEMVAVPDQDWIVYGAWITTPDDQANGENRVGVFHDGMQAYAYALDNRPMGSATYRGSATGVYKIGPGDAPEAGLFTADAMLTAVFDVADTDDDNMLSGRIDNFKDTRGFYLGSDTAADPNDPVTGGENDWVVILNDRGIVAGGGVTEGTVSGSADGVRWGQDLPDAATGGAWSAQLYGPATAAASAIPASGVVGQFWAQSGQNLPDMDPRHRAVVGAFGATKED